MENAGPLTAQNLSQKLANVLVSNFCFAESKKEQVVSYLRGLSVSEGMRKLQAMPLSLAEKMEIR